MGRADQIRANFSCARQPGDAFTGTRLFVSSRETNSEIQQVTEPFTYLAPIGKSNCGRGRKLENSCEASHLHQTAARSKSGLINAGSKPGFFPQEPKTHKLPQNKISESGLRTRVKVGFAILCDCPSPAPRRSTSRSTCCPFQTLPLHGPLPAVHVACGSLHQLCDPRSPFSLTSTANS